jgi:hypothetical protein
MYRLSTLICLLFTSQLWAAALEPVLESMIPGSITFIGESHKHIESSNFIKDLVASAIEQGQCPILALEIADSEQPAIDRALTQDSSASGIVIPASIDHLPLRQMIEDMAILKKKSPCLSVVAIDADISNPNDRDEWMAARLARLVGDTPIVVLIGALHTLKKVDWLVKSGKPSVAELLTKKGFIVKSFPQRWVGDTCGLGQYRSQRIVNADSPEALTILNDSLMSLINARPHKTVQGVIDGFILWECGNSEALIQKNEKYPKE